MNDSFVLGFRCENTSSALAAVTRALSESRVDIRSASQFDDAESRQLFMRVAFEANGNFPEFHSRMKALAGEHCMEWRITGARKKQRVLILVSRFYHCLDDLLYRTRIGELDMEVVGIVSNHPRESLLSMLIGDIPFHYLPVTKETKKKQEGQIRRLIDELGIELAVLARYMQILSEDFAAFLSGRCINIHHGLLPGFKGARPYERAHDCGVKVIGATAHYVTAELDEGPIIVQDVERISHADTAEILIRRGRDIERRVLADAVRFHLEGRVFLNGPRTVVLED